MIGAVLILSVGAVLLVGGRRIIEQERMAQEVDRLREGLYRARATAERCQKSIVSGETELVELRARLDLLRARVDSFEALDNEVCPRIVMRPTWAPSTCITILQARGRNGSANCA